jgi:hypothetical protein
VLFDVPGELLWASYRWAAVDSLSVCCRNPISDCAKAVLLSDPTQTEPLHKLAELEILMMLPHDAEHLRVLLEGILSRAPHVRALYLEAFQILAMPRLSGLKHLMILITKDLHPCFCESLQSLEAWKRSISRIPCCSKKGMQELPGWIFVAFMLCMQSFWRIFSEAE